MYTYYGYITRKNEINELQWRENGNKWKMKGPSQRQKLEFFQVPNFLDRMEWFCPITTQISFFDGKKIVKIRFSYFLISTLHKSDIFFKCNWYKKKITTQVFRFNLQKLQKYLSKTRIRKWHRNCMRALTLHETDFFTNQWLNYVK